MAELGESMGAAELTEWIAFFELEPWGEERMDLRFATLNSILVNALRGKGQKPVTPADLMPDFGGDRKERGIDLADMTREEQLALARSMAAALAVGKG